MVKLLVGAESSQGLTGEGSISKLTQVGVGRLQSFLAVSWRQQFIAMWTSPRASHNGNWIPSVSSQAESKTEAIVFL